MFLPAPFCAGRWPPEESSTEGPLSRLESVAIEPHAPGRGPSGFGRRRYRTLFEIFEYDSPRRWRKVFSAPISCTSGTSLPVIPGPLRRRGHPGDAR